MKVCCIDGTLSPFEGGEAALERMGTEVADLCGANLAPLRLAITANTNVRWACEVEAVETDSERRWSVPSLFQFRRRGQERAHAFNAVMLVPTGIDCAIGGHAGDATPAARVLASVCDTLIVHPNVVNASDVNEQTENCLYVEGSLICRLLMGTISLRKTRSNRILVVTEARDDSAWVVDQVINTTNAARATLGIDCSQVVVLEEALSMEMQRSPSGRAVGEVAGLERLCALLESKRDQYDAVALSTKIVPCGDAVETFHQYFGGVGPNPWGGVEAALTHTVSSVFDVPSAHAPTMEDERLRTIELGRVDPRKSAEAISTSYMFCLFKGLHRAPGVVSNPTQFYDPSLVAAEDISCLVIPDRCIGLPVIAALVQRIPVIAVRGNTNLMKNDLSRVPGSSGLVWMVGSYLEAAGLIAAMKAGIHPGSLTRPMCPAQVIE